MHPRNGRVGAACHAAPLLAALAACSGYDKAMDGGSLTGETGDLDSGNGTADGGTDVEMGTYWTVDADLVVVEGVVDAASSTLWLGRRRNSSETCADQVVPLSVTPVEPLPHASVYTWWEVSWNPTALICFSEGEGGWNQPLLLGVGEMHAEIAAIVETLDEVQVQGAAAQLNATYARLPGDDRLLVYGAAGLEQAWAGEGKAATSGPLEDGTWLIRTLYSFPLTW